MLPLPSLRFTLFGFPISIGLDFLLITFFLGAASGSAELTVAWVVVVGCSILLHELGHALALRRYGVHAQIMLWGMGGLTFFRFALPPRKAIVVSLAGPFFGIPVGLLAMVALPLFERGTSLATVVFYVEWVNLWWGMLNLLPIAGLDGGNVVTNVFVAVLGPRGRAPGLVAVAAGSVLVAVGAAAIGFPILAVLIVIFGFINPSPYLEVWRILKGGLPRSHGASGRAQGLPTAGSSDARSSGGDPAGRSAAPSPADQRRAYGEAYAETLGDRARQLDLDDLGQRPAPLMPEVAAMVARGDDAGIAARLVSETDPLAVIAIVARIVEGRRVTGVIRTLRQGDERTVEALLKLQVGLYSLGRFEESIGAANALGARGNAGSALLVARCAARIGDRKLVGQALERAAALGPVSLSDAALGDIARVGPDERLSSTLARLRSAAPPR